MDMQERLRLKNKYSQMPDEELESMLQEGKGAFREGIYGLLQEEAEKRGIEFKEVLEKQELKQAAKLEQEIKVPTFVQLIIITDAADVSILESMLDSAGISYYFQSLSFRGKDLPTSLMIEEPRVEDAINLLKDFKPKGGIVLW